MDNKYLFEVETAWPFPVVQYTADTLYIEVRKASGIAYILLQLINCSENNAERIVITLESLGVPSDIHYIFAGELANMISYDIIRMKSGQIYSADLINMYDMADFEITDLGKKLFAEGAIPTGNNKVKKIQVYYDLPKKDIKVKCDRKLLKYENSMLDEKCIGDVVLNNSDVESFINDNMVKYDFRKGERISGIEHESPEVFVYKMDNAVTIRFTVEKMLIQAKDKDYNSFIQRNYSLDTISRIINEKKKYHFPNNIAFEIVEYDYSTISDVIKMYLPYQLASVASVRNQLSLSAKCDMKNSECMIEKDEAIDILQKCGVFGVACYFENGSLYSIVPGRFMFDVESYTGKCAVNMIVIQLLDDETKQQIMKEIFLKCIEVEDSIKRCNLIKKITEISKCSDYVEQFSKSELQKQTVYNDRINIFLHLNDEFTKLKGWREFSINKAKELLGELCEQISIDNFVAQNVLGKKLNKILGLNDHDYLSRIARNIVLENDNRIAFETIEGLGYSTDTVLGVVNIFETYCQQIIDGEHINGNSKLSGQCILVGQSLSELKKITGIFNPYKDSANLDLDYDSFIQVMAAFTDSKKKLEKYKVYALEQYKWIDAFFSRYTEIKEVVTIEKEAMKNPENINKSYIEQRLKKARYKDAICDLHVRLQYELNRLFNTEHMATYNLLSDSRISNYLSKDEIQEMHSLRICRNGFQHPKENRQIQYTEQIIRVWCDIVEKLGGMNNESSGKN